MAIAAWWIPGAPLIIGVAATILGLTTGPLWHYDSHRFIYGDGWKSLGRVATYDPREWKWLPPAEVVPVQQTTVAQPVVAPQAAPIQTQQKLELELEYYLQVGIRIVVYILDHVAF